MELDYKKELALYRKSTADLASELNDLIKLVKFLRSQVEEAMMDKESRDLRSLVKATCDISTAFAKAVDSKVKLDKHLTKEAEVLSEQEQCDAVTEFLKDVHYTKRRDVISELLAFHRKTRPADF